MWNKKDQLRNFVEVIFTEKRPVILSSLQRLTLILYVLQVPFIISLDFFGLKCSLGETYIYLVIAASGCLINGIMYFFSFNKYLAHITFLLDKATDSSSLFLIVGFLLYFSFAISMYLLHIPLPCGTLNGTSFAETAPQRDMFTSLFGSVYETFLLSLGVMIPNDIYFKDSHIPYFTIFIYISFLFMLLVIMLNLLIALLSDKISNIYRKKDLIIQLQSISASLVILHYYRGIQSTYDFKLLKRFFPALYRKFTLRNQLIRSDESNIVVLEVVKRGNILNKE